MRNYDLMRKFDPGQADPSNLQKAFERVKLIPSQKRRGIWKAIQKRPLNIAAVEQLIATGLTVETARLRVFEGWYNPNKKAILIGNHLQGYERDLTLVHELNHAWFGPTLDDHREMESDHPYQYHSNTIILEWLSRQQRSNVDLLRHTVLAFDLQPFVYDRISAMAFDPQGAD